jgi:hypothetical protein
MEVTSVAPHFFTALPAQGQDERLYASEKYQGPM